MSSKCIAEMVNKHTLSGPAHSLGALNAVTASVFLTDYAGELHTQINAVCRTVSS
jgi:hypothetical protein